MLSCQHRFRSLVSALASYTFVLRSLYSKRSVTTSISDTSGFASKVVTSILLYDSRRLANKYTTRSSSDTGSSITDSDSNVSVIDLMCFYTDSPSHRRNEYNLRRSSSLFAHDFFWNWLANFFHTSTGLSGSPIRYNNEGCTERTITANTRSLLAMNFPYSNDAESSGGALDPSTKVHNPSFIRAMQHWIFHVG